MTPDTPKAPHSLLIFGQGYVASALCRQLDPKSWEMQGTSRSVETPSPSSDSACLRIPYSPAAIRLALQSADHVLICVPPDSEGCPVFREYGTQIQEAAIRFIGYLSTTGVYGDHQGAWVSEDSETRPRFPRSLNRKLAEDQWLGYQGDQTCVNIFRLPGIYGPGRNALKQVPKGEPLIHKEGHVFSRIHVKDICQVLEAAMRLSLPGETFNVADDYPCANSEVQRWAANLLGLPTPKVISFEEAGLQGPLREFYSDNRRVSNQAIKNRLGVSLEFPTFREGLTHLLETGTY